MRFSSLATAALLLVAEIGIALPTAEISDVTTISTRSKSCSDLRVRKEWRALSKKEKLAYIAAVKCLQCTPGKTAATYPGVRSRFDDYQALHIAMTGKIHFVGQFFPWHRGFVSLWEKELVNTCKYTGAQPYWDWTQDSASVEAWNSAPVFDSVYGFGGNGAYIADKSNLTQTAARPVANTTGGGCLQTGPFANMIVNLGPGNNTAYNPHCLRRDFAPVFGITSAKQSVVDFELAATDFADYDFRVEAGNRSIGGVVNTHASAHWGVGGNVGDMADTYSSPGDPVFWLHHGQLDKHWNDWQRKKWPARKTDIGGPDTMWAYPFNWTAGDIPYKNITLDYPLDFGQLGGVVKVRDVMDITSSGLCYTYA